MKNTLTAVQIKAAPDGKLYDGGGLMLAKSGAVGKWLWRYSHLGKRREMGLGPWPAISLAEARRTRDSWAAELAAGRDPIAQRTAHRAAEIAERDRTDPTVEELISIVFEAKQDTLRGGGTRGFWLAPLKNHISPKMGRERASAVDRHLIAEALRPIWRKKHPTADKAWQRLRMVLREGRLMGYDCDPFDADAARRTLGDVRHMPQPHPATSWQDIPDLYTRLGEGPTADCLRFMILTVAREHACMGARRSEIDGDIWTVPAVRVKGTEGRVDDFRIPLSQPAITLADRVSRYSEDLLFATYTGRAVTGNALLKRLRTMNEDGRPHGFRTSFRTWVQDTDACSWEVA